ncbi:MAG: hypothetical protein ACYC35_16900 [Pirellulales bacterium]
MQARESTTDSPSRKIRSFQYSLRTLLIATALSAVAFSVATTRDNDVYFILLLGALCASAGYLAGWTSRIECERAPNLFICASIFVVFNWLLWYVNHIALSFVRRATDRDLSPLLSSMAEADRLHCFDVMAGLITVVIAWATLRQDRGRLIVSGAVCALIWMLLMTQGFLLASICLIDVD